MWKPLIRCSILGGVIAFLWFMISWTVLPMHKANMEQFINPAKVEQTIAENAPRDGIYALPEWNDNIPRRGNFILVNIKRNVDFQNMTGQIICGVITQIIGAFVITFILLKAKAMRYWKKVWFVTLLGVFAGFLGVMPSWTWWHFPGAWVFLDLIDYGIAWFLGGLVIARLSKK